MSTSRELWRLKRVGGTGSVLDYSGAGGSTVSIPIADEQTLGSSSSGGAFVKATPESHTDTGTLFSTPNDRDRYLSLSGGTLTGEQYNGTAGGTTSVTADVSAYLDGAEHEFGFGYTVDDGLGNQRLRLFVDGTQVAEATYASTTSVANGDSLHWGEDFTTQRGDFDGTISEAAMVAGIPDETVAGGVFADPNDASVVLHYDAAASGGGTTVADQEGTGFALAVDSAEWAEIDTDVFDIRTTDAVNRYASNFVAQLDDPMGAKAAEYPRGTRALAEYTTDGGATWQTKQAGFVNYFNDTGRDATDQAEVLFIGYDNFLRRRPVFETFGEPGAAHLSFDATDGYVDVPGAALPATDAITISLWTKGGPSQPASDSILEAANGSGGRVMNIHLPWGNGLVYWDFGDDPWERISVDLSGMDWQSWHHWAFVVDSTEPRMAIYRDGERMAVDTTVGKALTAAPSTFHIAANQAATKFYDGTVEDVQIFTRDLTAAEITDLSQGTDVSTGLASRFPMDDGSGTTVTESVSGNNGTLTGTGYEWVTEPAAPPDEAPPISTALETLITQHTAVNWNAANVDVVNDTTIKRQIKGEKADEVLSYLASTSGGEEYGVNDEFEFFFHPREISTAPSNILNGDWFDYDLPEEGRQAVNQVRIFYGEAGSRSSVIVEDRAAQRDLQAQLDAPRRVVLSKEAAYPEIGNEAAAYAKGREILEGRSPLRTGTVKTFQRHDWEPGDVFRLEIPPKGIDTTFRAAEIEHHWARGETRMKVAENEGNVGDLLVGMSDDIERLDFREADPDATYTRFLELNLGATVSISGQIAQRVLGADSFIAGFGPNGDHAGFLNTGAGQPQPGFDYTFTESPAGTGAASTAALNQFRDAWQGETAEEITHVALGTGTSKPTQSNTELEAEVYRDTVTSVSATGPDAITFEAGVEPGGPLEGETITEFGFLDASGDLHGRTVLDAGVTHTADTRTTVSMTFTVATDPTAQGVVTTTGQTVLRDLYLDHANALSAHPTDRAYGTGATTEAETDTALAAKVGERAISSFADGGVGRTDSVIRFSTAEQNGTAFAELGDENAANDLLTRVTFETVDKTTDFALESNNTLTVRPIIL